MLMKQLAIKFSGFNKKNLNQIKHIDIKFQIYCCLKQCLLIKKNWHSLYRNMTPFYE